MKKIFAVLLVSVSLTACIGKGPVVYGNGYGYAPAYTPATVTYVTPYEGVIVGTSYTRQPACRFHGNPEADGYYGCADSKQF